MKVSENIINARLLLLIILFALSNLAIAQYEGGIGDGYSSANVTNNICFTLNPKIYSGGIGNGFAEKSLLNSNCFVLGPNIFVGGIGNGFTEKAVTNSTCFVPGTNIFSGGIGYGHSDFSIVNTVCILCSALISAIPDQDEVCEGEYFNLKVEFTGRAPFRFTYTNGTEVYPEQISSEYTYEFATQAVWQIPDPVSPVNEYTYTVVRMIDDWGCLVEPGEGSATIIVYRQPQTGTLYHIPNSFGH